MKDQKPFIIGLGLGVLIIAGIALSKPKQSKEATAPSASKPSQAAAKPEPRPEPEPEPETPNKPAAPEPAEASVMALVDAVDEPAGKIRVLTGIALSHVKADKDASLSAFTWLRAMPVSTRIFPAGSSTASTNAMTEASAGSGAAGLLGVSGSGSGSGLGSGLAAACEGLDADGAVASLDCLGLLNAIPAMIRTPRPRPMMNGF